MPAVQPPAKVLVTGTSGFIALWVSRKLLEEGYAVRGTVRSKAKGDYIVGVFNKLGLGQNFDYVVVEDMSKEGAFDEAVKGMDAVEHTASPYHFKANDPDELIIPAVNGTKGVLSSILKHAPSVKRVVITSSVAAIIEPSTTPRTLSEKDWNTVSIKEVQEKGREAHNIHKYRASKILAEKAAWDFVKENQVNFDIVTMNPPLVWGPLLHDVSNPDALNTSLIDTYALIKGKQKPTTNPAGNWVDVRDLADAHARSLKILEAGGERFIVCGGPFTYQDVLDAIHASPQIKNDTALSATIPRGQSGAGKDVVHPIRFDTSKVERVLGLRLRSLEECAGDMAKRLLEKDQEWSRA